MISVLDISLVKCYGTVKTKEESFLFQKPIASSTLSVMTLFPSLLASHAFLDWMMSLATLSLP